MNLFEKFNIKTKNEKLYETAFTHASYAAIHNLDYNYERLEFLGDSVLNFFISDYIFKKYPNHEEGKLSKIRVNYICNNALIFYAAELELINYLKISHNLKYNEIITATADILESFIGALYLDQGLEFLKKFLSEHIFKYIDEEKIFFIDYKSKLKEFTDKMGIELSYEVLEERGVPHDMFFLISCSLDNQQYGVGQGKNKKEAQQEASKQALETLKIGDKK